MTNWLTVHWVACALVMGTMLLLFTPVLAIHWTMPMILLYLQMPIYMLHQVEEHWGDRFRQYVNRQIFGGAEALSHAAILVINIPGVWGVNLLSLYAANFAGIGWGLAAVYLTLFNALVHMAGGLRSGYNPGLWTAVATFVPIGGAAWWAIGQSPEVTRLHHITGLAIAVGVHLAIVVYAKVKAGATTTSGTQ